MEITITWNICRVCLAEEGKNPQVVAATAEPMRHIFNEDEMLAKQIYECSGITMKPKDNLPEKICKKCYTLMKYAVNFRETCRTSDTYLQNILQCTKSASTLLKKQQPPSLEEISNDCETVDNHNGDANETSDQPKEKSSKSFNDLEYLDLIEIENEDFANEDDLKTRSEANILDYTGSCYNDAMTTVKHYDDDESDDCQTDLEIGNSIKQNRQLSEEIENYDQNDEDSIPANTENEVHDNGKSYEQFEVVHEERNMCGIESESESEESQEKVSSTVAIIEDGKYEIIGLEAEDTHLSGDTIDTQTEYIIDELLSDGNSRDSKSLQSSSAQYVHLKKVKTVVKNKYEAHKSRSNGLRITASSKVGDDIQVWVCDMCGNHFGNRHHLNNHIKVHRQEKNHECEICLKRFITACNLQAHMRIHTGEKPFECKYCGRRFSDRSSNLRHERVHTNERPFECNLCGKTFSLGTTLKKHCKVHTGERSFRCDVCAKSFKLPHQLKAHKNSSLHKAVEQLTQTDQ